MAEGVSRKRTLSSDYMTVDDLSIPDHHIDGGGVRIHERCNSESDLALLSPQPSSCLFVDKQKFIIGKDFLLTVSWDIKLDVCASDWIGLFLADETDSSKFIDSKVRGMNGGDTGEIHWDLEPVLHNFTDAVTKICFKYIQGNSGKVIATSSSVEVWNPAATQQNGSISPGKNPQDSMEYLKVVISDIEAKNLRKGMFFNPDPYIKMVVLPGKLAHFLPHHNQELRTSIEPNTTNPTWYSQSFTLDVIPSDILEFEVKDKFAKSRPTISRFLGKCLVSVQRIIDKNVQDVRKFSLDLTRRNPTENVSGYLQFNADVQKVLTDKSSKKNRKHRKTSLPSVLENNTQSKRSVRSHRHTDPGFQNSTNSMNNNENVENCQNGDVNLFRLNKGRIPESVEIACDDTDIASRSPPSLAAVPNIVCGSFNGSGPSGTDDGVAHHKSQPELSSDFYNLSSSLIDGYAPPSDDSGGSTAALNAEVAQAFEIQNNEDSSSTGNLIHSASAPSVTSVSSAITVSHSPESVAVSDSLRKSQDNDTRASRGSGDSCPSCSSHGIKGQPSSNSEDIFSDVGEQSVVPRLDVVENVVKPKKITKRNSLDDLPPAPPPPLPPPLPRRSKNKPAPPLPPRSRQTDNKGPSGAPPLPPRINERSQSGVLSASANKTSDGTARVESTSKLAPPPLPPRTYSPIHMHQGSGGSSIGSLSQHSEDSDRGSFDSLEAFAGSRENSQDFQTDGSANVDSLEGINNPLLTSIKGARMRSSLPHSLSQNHSSARMSDLKRHSLATVSAQLAQIPSIESAVSFEQTDDQLTALRTSAYSPIHRKSGGSSQQAKEQVSHLHPPPVHPRHRSLSEEEKQQNRQHIAQHLQSWTQKHLEKSNGPNTDLPQDISEVDGPVSASSSEDSSSREDNRSNRVSPMSQGSTSQVRESPTLPGQTDNTESGAGKAAVWELRQSRNFSSQGKAQGSPQGQLPKVPDRKPRYHRVDPKPEDDPLPSGWEARVDSHGRVFYIDHVNKTTTWVQPKSGQRSIMRRPTISSEQRQQLDRRYQSIRRTIDQSRIESSESSSSSAETTSNSAEGSPQVAAPAQPVLPPPPPAAVPTSTSPAQTIERSVYNMPAVKFLTRADFFPMLQQNENAFAEFNRNSTLKHMINKIRRVPQMFERYQHNRDLVSFINMFADTMKPVGSGWEMKFDRAGKAFFVDHRMKSTTFIDPRLPTDVPPVNPDFLHSSLIYSRSRGRGITEDPSSAPAPPPRHPAMEGNAAVPTAYDEKVVLFLRQHNIHDILKEKCTTYTSGSLKNKVNKIRNEGKEALDKYSNDLDLILLLSLFENDIMSYIPQQLQAVPNLESPHESPQASPGVNRANMQRVPAPFKRDFQAKLRNFYRKIESKGYGQGPGKLKLTARRDHVLEDSFNKVMSTPKKEFQKNKLYVTFAGEEGLDYGGPSREFFFLLSRELFNPYYGLFEYSANDTYTVQISSMSTFVENSHEWFRFAGRVLGLALIHQYLLDAFFTRPFYKALLRINWSLSDVETLDAEFYQSLVWIKENDITELDMELTFTVNEEVFGQVTERELKPNGKNIPVTEKNKKEYLEKMVKWRLERGVTEQTESLVRGFHEVIDPRLVSMFDARELELVIAGTVEIDLIDWRKNTEYRSGYHDQHPVIQWFWEGMDKFDNERKLRLLQFVTGTSSIPYEGFSSLRGSNGPRKFCIEKWGTISSLPRAHTCFNRLDLPPYTTSEMLLEKLVIAVEETSTFGIE